MVARRTGSTVVRDPALRATRTGTTVVGDPALRATRATPTAENPDESERWLVLRRYDDGLEAELARTFLRDHGVDVALQGNSGASAILNRFDTVVDIRLLVREEDLERARETLRAMTPAHDEVEREPPLSGDAHWSGSPYREARVHLHEADAEDHGPKPRYRRAAFVLAFALPIGAGHFYARHNVSGALFAIAIATLLASAVLASIPSLWGAAAMVVLADAVLSIGAVRRYNEGRTASSRRQALTALGVTFVALSVWAI